MIGPLFVAAGISAFDLIVGLVVGNLLAVLSLGLCATPFVAIPLLNLVGLPIVVVAGVIAVVGLEERGRLSP